MNQLILCRLYGFVIEMKSLAEMGNCTELQELYWQSWYNDEPVQLSVDDLIALKNCRKVCSFGFLGCCLTDKEFYTSLMSTFPMLESLTIDEQFIPFSSSNSIVHSSVEYLHFRASLLTLSKVTSLHEMYPSLTELSIDQSQYRQDEFVWNSLHQFSKLTKLSFWENVVYNVGSQDDSLYRWHYADIRSIATLQNLQHLQIYSNCSVKSIEILSSGLLDLSLLKLSRICWEDQMFSASRYAEICYFMSLIDTWSSLKYLSFCPNFLPHTTESLLVYEFNERYCVNGIQSRVIVLRGKW